ncbi:hypothetical protein Tco_1258997 [Tanacetum coccineum]
MHVESSPTTTLGPGPDRFPDVTLHKYVKCFLSLKCFTPSKPLNVIVISYGMDIATTDPFNVASYNGCAREALEDHDLEPDEESVDTPLGFLDFRMMDSNDGEVLNELEEYGNAGQLCRQRAINSFDEVIFDEKKLRSS